MHPDFLGVGFFRCGTTWLHETLDSHPRVYVPQKLKEVHFYYDVNYQKGPAWYESFFPTDDRRHEYDAVGEIGPGYATKGCLDRIASEARTDRFIFMIRNHADRAYSGYRQAARLQAHPTPFEERVSQISSWGPRERYAPYIKAWLDRFGPDRVLVVSLEEVIEDSNRVQRLLAEHLGVDPALFCDPIKDRVNESAMPRFPALYRLAAKTNVMLMRHGLYRVSNGLKALGAKRLMGFGKGGEVAPLSPQTREAIERWFDDDIAELETLLDRDLSAVRHRPGPTSPQSGV